MSSRRLQIVVVEALAEKIDSYADMMGISRTDAARHLIIRGLEQVQLLVTSKNSAEALNRMTESFDRGLQLEERRIQEASSRATKAAKPPKLPKSKPVQGLVTPAQSLKNETNTSRVEDIFKND